MKLITDYFNGKKQYNLYLRLISIIAAATSPFGLTIFLQLILTTVSPSITDQNMTIRLFLLLLTLSGAIYIQLRLMKVHLSLSSPFISINLSHHHETRTDHELKILGRQLCTGCSGSILGIFFAEVIMFYYILVPQWFVPYAKVLIGLSMFFIASSLYRYVYGLRPKFRLFQHTLLPIGLVMEIIATDAKFNSSVALLCSIGLSIVILYIRLSLSRLFHQSQN